MAEDKQKQGVFGLYCRNVKGTFNEGYPEGPSTFIDPILAFWHTVFLPVSLTIGAGTKTCVDLISRKPLSDDDIEKMKNAIDTLDDDNFNKLVNDILGYQAKSNGSNQLKADLRAAIIDEKNNMEKIFNNECQKEINKRNADLLARLDPSLKNNPSFIFKCNAQLTDNEKNDIRKRVTESNKDESNKNIRQAQQKAIKSYLDDIKNVGKKMEHVIKGACEKLVPSFAKR